MSDTPSIALNSDTVKTPNPRRLPVVHDRRTSDSEPTVNPYNLARFLARRLVCEQHNGVPRLRLTSEDANNSQKDRRAVIVTSGHTVYNYLLAQHPEVAHFQNRDEVTLYPRLSCSVEQTQSGFRVVDWEEIPLDAAERIRVGNEALFAPIRTMADHLRLTKRHADDIIRECQVKYGNDWPDHVYAYFGATTVYIDARDNDYRFGHYIEPVEDKPVSNIVPDGFVGDAYKERIMREPEAPANLDEILHPKTSTRAPWGAEAEGKLAVERIKMAENHFKREIQLIAPEWDSQSAAFTALGTTIADSIDRFGITQTVDNLQGYLVHFKSEVESGRMKVAKPAITKEAWSNFLNANEVLTDVALAALEVEKFSEYEGTLDEALTAIRKYERDETQKIAQKAPISRETPPTRPTSAEPSASPASADAASVATGNVTATSQPGNPFKPASRASAYLRMALVGPSGSGKTYTGLKIASNLVPNGKVAVIDTERGSASKYANLFKFDVVELRNYHPDAYIKAIQAAAKFGYDVLLIDSLSHAWNGTGGVLAMVDQKGGRFDAWKDVTPLQLKLVDAMLDAPLHIIATMRSKTEYVVETVEVNGRMKSVPRKVGLAPVQRDGMEYEFDVFAEIDMESTLNISKSRCPDLTSAQYPKAGSEVAAVLSKWLAA